MDAEQRARLIVSLRRDARRIADHFDLQYREIEPERPNVKARYGLCTSDGLIKIRLFHATTRRPLRYSSLIDTLCHELAHLRHFNHGPDFKRFYLELLTWARRQGIYQPKRRGGVKGLPPTPQQAHAKVPQRNGVAVFPGPQVQRPPAPPSYRPALPWEQERDEQAAPTPQIATEDHAPQQTLPLFDLGAKTEAPRRRRARAPSKARTQKQLQLF